MGFSSSAAWSRPDLVGWKFGPRTCWVKPPVRTTSLFGRAEGAGPNSTKNEFLGGGFKYCLFAPRKLGKISNLANIFQMG